MKDTEMGYFIATHEKDSPTLDAIRVAITAMRWSDLEQMAEELDDYRRGAKNKSESRLTGDLLHSWSVDTVGQ